ncbi:hypothetical protein KVT40_005912 [Elsinoe batatas]|uniref:Uncharacterized protein n=1 Tax=Elsinoe batatas TaxID=2601811 RepID=A0A8K0L0P6_9PEZI|nr:hypothetical protein KVT40_005912 [Elsinoe batatas]
MPFATRTLRLSRPLTSSLRNTTTFTQRLPASIRLASSDYGSPTGGPISENPKDQGPNPSADKEHPGPPPAKAGQSRPAEVQASTQTKNGARPKILSDNPPKDSEASEEVKRHNEEMDRRAERAAEGVKSEQAEGDKVPKEFWKGDVGEKKDGRV